MTRIPSRLNGIRGTGDRGTWTRSRFIGNTGLASAGILLFKDKETKDKVNRYKGCVKRKGKQEHSKGDKPPTNRQSHVAR